MTQIGFNNEKKILNLEFADDLICYWKVLRSETLETALSLWPGQAPNTRGEINEKKLYWKDVLSEICQNYDQKSLSRLLSSFRIEILSFCSVLCVLGVIPRVADIRATRYLTEGIVSCFQTFVTTSVRMWCFYFFFYRLFTSVASGLLLMKIRFLDLYKLFEIVDFPLFSP